MAMLDGPLGALPLSPALQAELESWLSRVHKPATAAELGRQLERIAPALTSGPPVRDLFLYAAAVALTGAQRCTREQQVGDRGGDAWRNSQSAT